MSNFWLRKYHNRPNVVLAPMAGYSDSAMRQICKEFGADIVVSEMVSADAIFHNKKFKKNTEFLKSISSENSTIGLMKFKKTERPFVVQLFGKHPEKFAYAARWVEKYIKADGIDINMGCLARKVVGSDHGSALIKDPKLACDIVEAVKKSVNIPVSVKTRLGQSDDDEILEFSLKLCRAGIDALIIHGRTYKDGFGGDARWENIYKVASKIRKENKGIAVIGNGDIKSHQDALDRARNGKLELDGVMIGRAAFGKPWIFSKQKAEPKAKLIKDIIIKHAMLAYDEKGERGIIEFRKHLIAYLKGIKCAKKLRINATRVRSVKDVERICIHI